MPAGSPADAATAALATPALVGDAGVVGSASTRDQVTLESVLATPMTPSETAYTDDLLARGESSETIAYRIAQARGFPMLTGRADIVGIDPTRFAPSPSALAPAELVADDGPPFGASAQNQNSIVFAQVVDRQTAFLKQVRTEFAGFPGYVQTAFGGEAKLNGVSGGTADGVSVPARMDHPFSDAEISYLVIRSLLWKTGYRHPPELFSTDRIAGPQEATFLDKPIQNGVDRAMLAKLKATEAAIPSLLLGLALRDSTLVAPRIDSIIGFQPRRIAGYPVLSHHAFGDGVDIDARWNPLLAGAASKVIQDRSGIDFAQAVISPDNDIDSLLAELTAGSDQFRQWIQSNLPKFQTLEAQLDQATKDLADAIARYNAATTQADRDTAKAAVATASKQLAAANAGLMDPDIADVLILRDALPKGSTANLQDLAQAGYLTVGAVLVKALIDPQGGGFKWGGSWPGDRKDFMHFDYVKPKPDISGAGPDGVVPPLPAPKLR
jgi:hypothetical protein